MSRAHTHTLTVHGHTPVHLLPAHVKLVAMLGFVLAVVLTPAHQVWAFAVFGLLVTGVWAMSEIPLGYFVRRLGVEIPFVAFAFMLPFLGGGERVELAGMAVSSEGLWAAWNILAKATLGVSASVLLVSTTELPHILHGLGRLRVPGVIVAIAGFMIRYLEVIAGELSRMRIAMLARGYDPRWIGQIRALGMAGGALFVRSYERGERVHQAMVARGFTGTMPTTVDQPVGATVWSIGLAVPVAAWVITLAAVMS